MKISHIAVSGMSWMFTSSFALQGVGLLVNIALARLLAPADFGAVALVLGFVGILQTFAELGTSVALVQRPDIDNTVIDSAFVSTCAVTGTIVCLLFFSAPQIAAFFNLPVMTGLIRIVAVSYLFRGLYALYRCLLLRELRYREISLISFVAYCLYGVSAVVFAWLGCKAYSIAWAQLVWTVSLLVMGLGKTGYCPKSAGKLKVMFELVAFGSWVSLGRLLRNASGKIDTLIIGKLLSPELLGGYHLAQRLVMLLPQTYAQIIDQVMLPIYATWRNDVARVEKGYWKVLSHMAILLTPVIALLFVFAEPVVLVVLGNKWAGIVPLVRIMSLYGLMRILGDGIFDSVIIAMGKPQVITMLNTCRMVVMPLVLIVGCLWGVVGVAWAFSLYSLLGRGAGQWLLRKYYGFSLRRYWIEIQPAVLAAIAATSISMLAIRFVTTSEWSIRILFQYMAIFFLWNIVYVILVFILNPEKFHSIVSILRERVIDVGMRHLKGSIPIFQKK